jgi:hypothetical protein
MLWVEVTLQKFLMHDHTGKAANYICNIGPSHEQMKIDGDIGGLGSGLYLAQILSVIGAVDNVEFRKRYHIINDVSSNHKLRPVS